jgi:hypothetical protein
MFMDMTASGGSDYVPQPVTVAFSPGQEEVSFEVMTVEDNIAEISESFKIISLSSSILMTTLLWREMRWK